jgi:hypothetical protein
MHKNTGFVTSIHIPLSEVYSERTLLIVRPVILTAQQEQGDLGKVMLNTKFLAAI